MFEEVANLFDIRITPDASDLRLIESDLNQLLEISEAALEQIAADLRFGWRVQIVGVGAVDTRDFVLSVAEHKITPREFVIDTSDNPDVIYSDIVERGRRDRPSYPARYPAEKSADAFERADRAQRRFDEALFRFLHQ